MGSVSPRLRVAGQFYIALLAKLAAPEATEITTLIQPNTGKVYAQSEAGTRQKMEKGCKCESSRHATAGRRLSLDLGVFENQLPGVTALLNEQGLASAIRTGAAGTTVATNTLTVSPVTSRLNNKPAVYVRAGEDIEVT